MKVSVPARSGGVSRSQAAKLKASLGGVSFPPLPTTGSSRAHMATGSLSMKTYADVARGRSLELSERKVSPYLAMLADPFPKENVARYPDETIVPTALVHLTTSSVYAIAGDATFFTALSWKATTVADGKGVIIPVQPLATVAGGYDYGAPQTSWEAVSSIDRTLACAARVRLVGLPPNTFLPSGTIYFLQVQQNEFASLLTSLQTYGEGTAIQAVTAGKGFSCTTNEMSKTDGVHISHLPQGPMSFVFSNTGNIVAGEDAPSSNLSSNGVLMVVGFGLNPLQELRFDYVHHVEYVPRFAASGLIATRVEPPSAPARDAIAKGSALLQQSRAGATNLGENPGSTTRGVGALLSTAGKMALGFAPGARPVVSAAAGLSEAIGAPAWLTTAMRSLL